MAKSQDKKVSNQDSKENTGQLTHKEIMVVLGGLMTGLLLAALDQTIVSTALKNIVEDFNGLNHYTWVVTAYLLTSTASTPLYGKISDLYGRRPVFQFAIITFLIGSFLAGASQNMTQLIFTRLRRWWINGSYICDYWRHCFPSRAR
jgi:MFS family permease